MENENSDAQERLYILRHRLIVPLFRILNTTRLLKLYNSQVDKEPLDMDRILDRLQEAGDEIYEALEEATGSLSSFSRSWKELDDE